MAITLDGSTGIVTPDITSTAAPALVGTNFTSLPVPAAGAVGSYVWGTSAATGLTAAQFVFGTTYAGTGLFPAGFSTPHANTGTAGLSTYLGSQSIAVLDTTVSALSGTWRCMGQTNVSETYDEQPISLFLRIS